MVFPLTERSEDGKADAGLAVAVDVATSLYAEGRVAARDDLRRIAGDERLQAALRGADAGAIRQRTRELAGANGAVLSITVFDASGREIATGGSDRGVAPAVVGLTSSAGERQGTLAVSVTDGRRLVAVAKRRTRLDVAVLRGTRTVARTGDAAPKRAQSFEAGGRTYRARRAVAGRLPGATEEIVVLNDVTTTTEGAGRRRLFLGALLLGLLGAALAGSVAVSRGLHAQVEQFLHAARRLARGSFDEPVSTKGNDAFAELGREFNSMSDQLKTKIGEVERKRTELEQTIRRIGTAFATGLDRQGVFELTVQTAIDACEADCGRGLALDKSELAPVGAASAPGCEAALEAAERDEMSVRPETGDELLQAHYDAAPAEQREPSAREHGGVYTLSLRLLARLGNRTHATYIAVIALARESHPFSHREAELLAYLAGQAVVSIENADLHETVRRQSVTDELTGLANVREMHGALDRELERGRRHETPVGFVLLDIDNFKKVNDTYGHQQGDEVLQAVSSVLREASRDIDEPARYGGEELAVVLPQTDLDGAVRMAERVRRGIEALRIPLLDQPGEMRVTASVGVASVPSSASAKTDLIAAADAALYRAKRGGKNRVERAQAVTVGV